MCVVGCRARISPFYLSKHLQICPLFNPLFYFFLKAWPQEFSLARSHIKDAFFKTSPPHIRFVMLGRGRGVQRDEHHSSILSIPLSPSSCSLSLYLEADPPPWALQSRVWQIQTRLSLLRSDMYGWAGLSVWGAAIGWTGGGGDSRAGVARGGHRFAYVRKQEGVTGQLMDINTVLLAIHQTPTNEGLQGWVGVDIKTGLVTLKQSIQN